MSLDLEGGVALEDDGDADLEGEGLPAATIPSGLLNDLPQNAEPIVASDQQFRHRSEGIQGSETEYIPAARQPQRQSHQRPPPMSFLPLHSTRQGNSSSTMPAWALSASSKTAHVEPNITRLSNGFITGTMSDRTFCDWVLSGPVSVRNAVITDVTWWSSKRIPFNHQFVILSISYYPLDATPSSYNIIFERIGKGINPFREAQHRVTIQHAASLEPYCSKNYLLLGLLDTPAAQRTNDALWGWIDQLNPEADRWFMDEPAFATALDEKWRGPPATLAHVAKYTQLIVESAPLYNLSSTNCYYFSRLLVHSIALRHYTFASVVRPPEGYWWEVLEHYRQLRNDDQSTTLIIFLSLEAQQDWDGVRVYRDLTRFLQLVVMLGAPFFSVYIGLIKLSRVLKLPGWAYMLIMWLLGCMFLAVYLGVARWLVSRAKRLLRAQTGGLFRVFDEDVTMTSPEGQRGQYFPLVEMEFHERMRNDRIPPWPRAEQRYENLPRLYDGRPVHLALDVPTVTMPQGSVFPDPESNRGIELLELDA